MLSTLLCHTRLLLLSEMSILAFCSAEKIYVYKEDDDEKR
jgi:hypothetical protein